MDQTSCFRPILSHCVTLTFELQSLAFDMTCHLNVIHIYAKLFQNPSINDKIMDRQTILSSLTLNCYLDLHPNHTVLSHYTPPHEGQHFCQVLLNSSTYEGVMDQTSCFITLALEL